MDLGRKWLVDCSARKTQLFLFDRSNNTGSIDGSVLEKKSFLKMLGMSFSSKLDWDSYINSITKTTSKRLES